MNVADAQRDVRFTFRGGFAGQLVSAALWLTSAALGTWDTPRRAILSLVIGGFFIFPLTWLSLRVTGHRARLQPSNPFNQLAVQVAFALPLTLPLVGAATLYRLEWFYPAFMVALGAHYLPFAFLYGMPMFMGLCGALVGAGLALGLRGPASFALGAWVTGGLLIVAAFVGRVLVAREERKGGIP
jgi:hypothetical protein